MLVYFMRKKMFFEIKDVNFVCRFYDILIWVFYVYVRIFFFFLGFKGVLDEFKRLLLL